MKSSLDRWLRQVGVQGINAYQQHISPHKGYSCAHRIVHGGDSCSEHVKKLFLSHNLQDTIKYSQQRFRDCAQANLELKQGNHTPEKAGLASSQIQIRKTQIFPRLTRRRAIALMVPLFVMGFATPVLARGRVRIRSGSKMILNNGNYNDDEDYSGVELCCGLALVTSGCWANLSEELGK